MDEHDKSDEEIMQELMPGSSTFRPHILCPSCGWHFKRGLTDPDGEVREMVPDIVLVCGQCLRVLRSNEQLQFVALSKFELEALPAEVRMAVATHWQLAVLSLVHGAAEDAPTGPLQ